MNPTIKLPELIEKAKEHMTSQGYAKRTIIGHGNTWSRLLHYAKDAGTDIFNEELAQSFLKNIFGISLSQSMSHHERSIVRSMTILSAYSVHGFIHKEKTGVFIWPSGFEEACMSFLDYYSKFGYSKQMFIKHQRSLHRFADYIAAKGVKKPSEISAPLIHDYFCILFHYSKGQLLDISGTLKKALKYFYEKEFCDTDWSASVPKVRYHAQAKLSRIWSREELSEVLNSIDCENPTGKRDYAILLLVSALGIRSVDILNLRIDNFDWNNGVINIIQSKTGQPLSLPISEDVGKAVINYWKNGRPGTSAQELFVKHIPPYTRITALHNLMDYFPKAGVAFPPEGRHGIHSLRHSLASRLLESETPINIIGNILGHVSSSTASQYIKIDVEQLRSCALEVPPIG